MITCAPLPTAAAICTICCSATVSSPTRRRTSIGASIPASSLPSVLLPAPFSPHSAWHDPRRTSKLTSSRARAPGKRLLTWRKLTSGLFDVADVFGIVDVADSTDDLPPLLELQAFLGD